MQLTATRVFPKLYSSFPPRHSNSAVLKRPRHLGGHICANNEFHEADWFAAANSAKDLSKIKDPSRFVADTSDEEANLPDNPIDLDEEMMVPQKQIVKEIYENLPVKKEEAQQKNTAGVAGGGNEVEIDPAPGSHEKPQVEAPQHGEREQKMAKVEKDITKMESTHQISSQLPRQERIQGILEAIDKIAEDENRHYFSQKQQASNLSSSPTSSPTSSPSSSSSQPRFTPKHSEDLRSAVEENPSTEASYISLEGGIEDEIEVENRSHHHRQQGNAPQEEEEESYEINFSGDDDIMAFSFKAEDKEEKKLSPPSSERLRDVAAKTKAAGSELDPLTKLAAARQAYREHRLLTEESIRQVKPTVTIARIMEVAAGRAALIGVVAAIGSEILTNQSVLSQLLGRYEGLRQVEGVISQSRTLALAVITLSIAVTATETLFSGAAPPAGKYFGFSPQQQIWISWAAMSAFLGLVLYETMHSNRPLFPFWYLLR